MNDLNFNFQLSTRKALVIISLFTLVAYCNIYSNQFLWDDEFLIDENSYITSYSNVGKIFSSSSTAGFGTSDSFYRPMQMLMYTIAYSIGGHQEQTDGNGFVIKKKRVWVYHALNVLLHLACALLIFALIGQLFANKELALLTAVLWAIHPTHTEAITYMSGTADPLSVVFVLSACLLYLHFKQGEKLKWLAYGLATICFPLGMLAKEAIIILPGLVMIMDFMISEKRWHPQSYLWTLPFWLLAFLYMYLRDTVLDFDKTYQFYDKANIYTENIHYRAYTFLATLPEYLQILVYPVDLHMERRFPVFAQFFAPPVILGLLIFLLGFSIFIGQRKRQKPLASFAFLWFFIAFVPMCGILLPVNSFLLEHWLYLPSIGLFAIMAAGLLHTLKWSSTFKYLPLSTVIVFWLASTLHRNTDWRDPLTFYTNILAYNEGTARVHNNLAMAYAENKNFAKAITHYLRSIEMSDDTYPQPHYNLARIYILQRDYSNARKHLLRSLQISPNFKFSQELLNKMDSFLKAQDPGRQ